MADFSTALYLSAHVFCYIYLNPFPMNRQVKIFILLVVLASTTAQGQNCTEPPRVISYDSTVIGSGNTFYSFSFPKFDAMMGTLMEVRLEADVTLTYNFQLENRESITIGNYRVRVTREDEISGSALGSPISNAQTRTYGPYSLTAWDGNPGTGTDYTSRGPLYVMNHARVAQSVYNVVDYLGTGNVDFDYSTTTYSSVLGSVNYTFNATAQDTVRFRISYYYCATWFMAADISSFNVNKKNSSQVDLQWITLNEEKDRQYEIQLSYDGRNFETIDRRSSQPDPNQTGTYRYSHSLRQQDEQAKLIFRLKQVEKNGEVKYSALRVIDGKAKAISSLKAYPNPAHQSSLLVFSNSKRGNWDVELYNASGSRVKTYRFAHALTGRLHGLESLRPGLYIIKATDRNTLETRTERLVISNR